MTKSMTGYRFAQARTTAALRDELAADGKAEFRLHKDIVDTLHRLALPGVFWWHPAQEGKRDPKTVTALKALGFVAGIADLQISVPGGRMCFMEIKAKGGRVSREQRDFLAAMERNGHETAVVYSLEQALHALIRWGAVRGARVAA